MNTEIRPDQKPASPLRGDAPAIPTKSDGPSPFTLKAIVEQIKELEERANYVDSLKGEDDDAWGTIGCNLDFDARAFLIGNAAAIKQALADAEKLPDLYEACQEAISALYLNPDVCQDEINVSRDIIRAAIAKAEGRPA